MVLGDFINHKIMRKLTHYIKNEIMADIQVMKADLKLRRENYNVGSSDRYKKEVKSFLYYSAENKFFLNLQFPHSNSRYPDTLTFPKTSPSPSRSDR